jgi:U3 small nucleolar RNA-associated protein 15
MIFSRGYNWFGDKRNLFNIFNFWLSGGPDIKIWDLLAGGRLLTKMSPHNKTVTSLTLASRGTRLVSASLDRQVKFHNISTFKTVHSVSFPSPILTAAVSVRMP